MDGLNQPQQFPPQVIIQTPQCAAPMPAPLSNLLSINLATVTHYKPVEFYKLDAKGKPTEEIDRVAPCVFVTGSDEPIELTTEENAEFRKYWAKLQRYTAFQFNLITAATPPDAPAQLAPPSQPEQPAS